MVAPNRIESCRLAALGLVAISSSVGCGDGPPPIAEIGTGAAAFEGLSDTLEVIAGPQGGHHFILNARMIHLSPGDPRNPGSSRNPTTRFTVFRDGLAIDLDQPDYRLGYKETDDGFHVLPSGRIVQLEEAALVGLDGKVVRVEVEIRDSSGESAHDEAEVIAVVPPTVLGAGP